MPKSNLCKPKEDKLAVPIRGYFSTGAALSRALGCSPPTATIRFADPDKLTRADLRRLVKSGIPADDILEVLL